VRRAVLCAHWTLHTGEIEGFLSISNLSAHWQYLSVLAEGAKYRASYVCADQDPHLAFRPGALTRLWFGRAAAGRRHGACAPQAARPPRAWRS